MSLTDGSEIPVPGVRGVEHTADLGFEVEASDLAGLFRRGALGAMWLVLERAPVPDHPSGHPQLSTGPEGAPLPTPVPVRTLELAEEDLPALFRSWLRTLLFWEETDGFVTREVAISFAPVPFCASPDAPAFGLSARVEGFLDTGPRVREIKGVTLHGLRVERVGEGWMGRVIFDV